MVLVRTLPVTSLIDNFDPAMVICAVVMMDKWTLGHHLSVAVSAVKRSIGSTTGFHNHGEGPY